MSHAGPVDVVTSASSSNRPIVAVHGGIIASNVSSIWVPSSVPGDADAMSFANPPR